MNLKNQHINFIEYDLKNGLHVILHQDNQNPLVAVSVLYHVGSKNESIGLNGFAHFFEHLMFEGSKNIDRGDFFKYVSSNGGICNAYTSYDETFYYEIFPSNQIKLALWLESERMMHAKVDIKGINTQREVVKEEKRMTIDNSPYKYAISNEIPSLLFKKHPYRYPIIGYMKDLDSASEYDYINFYKKYYVPNNAILSIAGDINILKIKKYIEYYFNDIPKGVGNNFIKKIKEDPINHEIKSIYEDKNIQVPAVMLSYRGPNKINDDSYIFKIIDNILSQGESSIISKNIVNKQQIAAQAGSFFQDLEDYGIFTIYAIINPNIELDDISKSIDFEINNFKKNGINQKELDKQINILEKKFIDNNISMLGIASNLAHYKLYYNDTNLINKILEKYRKINLLDIKRVANKYLNENKRVRLYNIPSKKVC